MNTKNLKILNLRKYNKLSQSSFADKTGVSRSYIAQIEKGEKTPSDRYLKTIISVFGLQNDFFEDTINRMDFYNQLNGQIVAYYDFKKEEMKIFNEINRYYQRIVDVFIMSKQLKLELLRKEINVSLDLLSKIRANYLENRFIIDNNKPNDIHEQVKYLNEMLNAKENFESTYFLYHKEFYNSLMISQ